ncbi:MAG TPA: NYN domain-containing protein [Blastocatellia bacterium]|nr:NYN domain-containing protein [Blastocatellia bacterium]
MTTWLIDMGYITKASKGRFKLDYIAGKRLIEEKLNDQCQAMIFNSVHKHYGIEKGLAQFYYTIQQAGFIVHLYQMKGESQRQVDVAIASQAVWLAGKGHTIVLSSGDIDFLPAVRLITDQAEGRLILFTYDFGVHEDMIRAASDHWLFENSPQLARS